MVKNFINNVNEKKNILLWIVLGSQVLIVLVGILFWIDLKNATVSKTDGKSLSVVGQTAEIRAMLNSIQSRLSVIQADLAQLKAK